MYMCLAHDPLTAGLTWDQAADDPQLGTKRRQLVEEAASRLSEAGMIAFDRLTNQLIITDLGRIAAKYYVRHSSIIIFGEQFRSKMTEADVLGMLCMSTEVGTCRVKNLPYMADYRAQFEQIQVRESEAKELEQLMEAAPCAVKVCPLPAA